MVVGGAGVVVGVSGGIDTEMPAETDGDFDDDLRCWSLEALTWWGWAGVAGGRFDA